MNSIPTQGKVARSETPLGTKNKPVHGFLLRTPKQNYFPAQVMLDVRDFLDDLYELSATYKLKEITNGMQYRPSSIREEMLVMAGSWRASEVFVNKETANQVDLWVNPNHIHKERYSDALTKCDCGKMMVREKTAGSRATSLPHDGIDEHTADCTLQRKYDARSRLLANRARIIEQMLRLGHDGNDCYTRLGLKDQGTISHLVDRLGVNVQECKADFKERRANTLAELLPVFDTAEAGRIYGISPTTVRGILREHHDIDLRAMQDVREKNRRRIDGMYGDLTEIDKSGGRPVRSIVSDD